jgi:hypothetical protein
LRSIRSRSRRYGLGNLPLREGKDNGDDATPCPLPTLEGGGGGWKGFHDEGGHVRSLFRILFNHLMESLAEADEPDDSFLSPYMDTHPMLHCAETFYLHSPLSPKIKVGNSFCARASEASAKPTTQTRPGRTGGRASNLLLLCERSGKEERARAP